MLCMSLIRVYWGVKRMRNIANWALVVLLWVLAAVVVILCFG